MVVFAYKITRHIKSCSKFSFFYKNHHYNILIQSEILQIYLQYYNREIDDRLKQYNNI